MDPSNTIYCYLHIGEELVRDEHGNVEYMGGRRESLSLEQSMTYNDFVSKICGKTNIDIVGPTFSYTLPFDLCALQPLKNDEDLTNMFQFSDRFARVYICLASIVEDDETIENGGQRLIETNPGMIVEYRCSDDCHFMQLFVALLVSIHGFKMGCWPIISIDSSHMSGPYKGALFSASSYDADDGMFPLAYDLFSSENYKDWLWFLEKLKMVIGEKDVIIIFDRHQGIICCVLEVFGSENHAHCYRHIKENFSSFLTKLNIKGRKDKENALQMLDSITYASSMKVSNGKRFLEVELIERTCTCKAWQMFGIPCDHACATIRRMGFDVSDYVDDWYKYNLKKNIYSGSMRTLVTHDMPMIDEDGTVRDDLGHTYPFLNPPTTKRPPRRLKKCRIESQFM
ncbi:hypothetical protein AAG906_011079 [Vitis piasezkii]